MEISGDLARHGDAIDTQFARFDNYQVDRCFLPSRNNSCPGCVPTALVAVEIDLSTSLPGMLWLNRQSLSSPAQLPSGCEINATETSGAIET